MSRLNIAAIVIALNEEEFIEKCLQSIYPFVTRIYVVTNYDTDYHGNKLHADNTAQMVIKFDDPEKKIVLLFNRKIMDEAIQRNWAMISDAGLHESSHRQFVPHAHTLDEIRDLCPKTDFFWIVDADEIYDPESVPGAIDYLLTTKSDAISVRGHNFFKTWNYRIDLATDEFWQIGFLRPGRLFYSRRSLFYPRPIGWLSYVDSELSSRLIDRYRRQSKLPEAIAHFFHGSYVGDDERIRKKLLVSSHANEHRRNGVEDWFESVWKTWSPTTKNFHFAPRPEVWPSADYVPTSQLPSSIREAKWSPGWIDIEGMKPRFDRSIK